jgi:hypothetical protein
MKRRFQNARTRAQRLFFAWLDEAGPHFKIPLCVERRTDRCIEFTFAGIPPIIRGTIVFGRTSVSCGTEKDWVARNMPSGEINIYVDWQDQNWDQILWLNAILVKKAGGFTCYECLPEYRQTFPNREAIWRDHLFKPLLAWVNDELAAAKALGIYQTRSKGGTWAKLLTTVEDREKDCLIARVSLADH